LASDLRESFIDGLALSGASYAFRRGKSFGHPIFTDVLIHRCPVFTRVIKKRQSLKERHAAEKGLPVLKRIEQPRVRVKFSLDFDGPTYGQSA
jgi:hypothetical protein